MAKSHAYRNLDLCSKDCLCLFVCPTGASDTETGQIDFEKCIGCGACAAACPAHAITMIPNQMPPQQMKEKVVVQSLLQLTKIKADEGRRLNYLLAHTTNSEEQKLYRALLHSCHVVGEDLMREAGYMLPQSKNARLLLQSLQNTLPDSEKNIVISLLKRLPSNE